MRWPIPQQYSEAIQNPQIAFLDAELRNCRPVRNNLGLPRVISGNFASVFQLEGTSGRWVARCFSRNVPEREERYRLLSEQLSLLKLPFLVPFTFLQKGIKIEREWFPILKMQWLSGDTLGVFIERHLSEPDRLIDIARQFYDITVALADAGIAHGDLQHGNILVCDGQMRLIDYDGMYVPRMQRMIATEVGHQNYQHPKRTAQHFDGNLDRFSEWIIFLTLTLVVLDPSLWYRFHSDEDQLILSRDDFVNPGSSDVLTSLSNSSEPEIRNIGIALKTVLTYPTPTVVPALTKDALPKAPVTRATSVGVSGSAWWSDQIGGGVAREESAASSLDNAGMDWVFDHVESPVPKLLTDSLSFERITCFALYAGIVLSLIVLTKGTAPWYVLVSIDIATCAIALCVLRLRYVRYPVVVELLAYKNRTNSLKKEIATRQTEVQLLKLNLSELQTKGAHLRRETDALKRAIAGEEIEYHKKAEAEANRKRQELVHRRDTCALSEKTALSSALASLQESYLQGRLEATQLSQNFIPGIRIELKSELSLHGVTSAADILDYAIYSNGYSSGGARLKLSGNRYVKVRGIGPVKAKALVEWRKSLENQFRKVMPRDLTLQEREAICRPYQSQLRDIEQQLRQSEFEYNQQKTNIKADIQRRLNKADAELSSQLRSIQLTKTESDSKLAVASKMLAKLNYERSRMIAIVSSYRAIEFGPFLKRAARVFSNN